MNHIPFALLTFLCVLVIPSYGQNHKPSFPTKDIQIKLALKAAPAEHVKGAKVLGYNEEGKFVTIREGSNDLICLTDDPAKNNIHVACYFKALEPFMARGRDLRAEGYSTKEVRKIRGEEADAGKLKMPDKPAGLYVFDADQENVDLVTGEVTEGRLRSVIHVPYLTGEESGLPTQPVGGGMPWLMDEGSHRAHIMITPKQ